MKKLSIFLVLLILLTIIPQVTLQAAEPIVPNSSFEEGAEHWTGGTVVDGDSIKTKGKSYKATFSAGSFVDLQLDANPMIPGITYEFSFYAKADADGIKLQPIRIHAAGGYTYLPVQELTTSWEKYTIEFTHPNAAGNGTVVDGSGRWFYRILDKGTVWIDEVHIIDPLAIVEDENKEHDGEIYKPYVYSAEGVDVDMSGFDDIVGHWAEDTIRLMKNEKIVSGIDERVYQPDRAVTRAEFLKLLTAGFNLEEGKYEGIYSDVAKNSWYAGIIQNAYDMGIISESLIIDGNFLPDEAITREDAAVLANSYALYCGFADEKDDKRFSDESEISDYAKNAVHSVLRKNIICGLPDGSFNPDGNLTRAEAAQIMYNIFEKNGRMTVYVDTVNGSDSNTGTKAEPIKSIEKARKIVQQNNKNMKHSFYVFIKGGEIFLEDTIKLNQSDGGEGKHNVIYSSYGAEQAVFSGGKHFKGGWEAEDKEKGIYKLYVGTEIKTRQMFVDGLRMQRARTDEGFTTASVINADKTGYTTSDKYFKDYRNIDDMECVYYKLWTNPRCGVSGMEENDDGTLTITMDQPCWGYLMNKSHLAVTLPDYLENQYEFLDEPGEWYLDNEGWLYLIPYDFQNLEEADIVLPVRENLLTVTGDKENKVKNIAFVDLGFKYATWMRPSTGNGYSDAQGGRMREPNGELVPEAAVWIKYTDNLTVKDCTFEKLGLSGLNVTDWIVNADIVGNHIYDISGGGMYIGNHGSAGGAYGDEFITKNILIKNNYVHDYGIEYGSSDGIEGMTMQYVTAENNEIYNGRYSGLVLGYGSTGTRYAIDYVNNYVHDVLNENLYDGGAIYVTVATNGNESRRNTVANNYCVNQGNNTGVLYLDNGTTWWDVYNNVIDQRRSPEWYGYKQESSVDAQVVFSNGKLGNKIHDNYSTADTFIMSGLLWDNGKPDAEIFSNHIYEDGRWPQEALDLIKNSGLEPEYEQKYPAEIQVYDIQNRIPVSINKNETADVFELFKIKAYGRKTEEVPVDKSMFKFSTADTELISVTNDGKITSVGTGVAHLNIHTIIDGVIKTYRCVINSGDEFGGVKMNTDEIGLYEGGNFRLLAGAESKLGTKLEIKSVTYESENPSIVSVLDDGTVTALSAGTTNINVTAVSDETVSLKVPVTVKSKSFSESFNIDEYFVYDFSEDIKSTAGWLAGSGTDVVASEGNGLKIYTPTITVGNEKQFQNELLHMKLKINATGGWPSISLRSDTQTGGYGEASQYMVTFGAGNISVQRFNGGERRTFENPNFPSDFEYGKEYDLLIGAVNHDDSVEIIVCLDGERVMSFYDYDDNRITEQGHIQVYCRAGSIELHPLD